ncbi:MAM and LDL-receptor class A domain-containing protein 1-like [Styela clava]
MRTSFIVPLLITFFIYGLSTTFGAKRRPVRLQGMRRPTRKPERKVTGTAWYNCDFESGYCGWKNDSTAEFQWFRTNTETPTGETGPRWDHTKAGDRGEGHYLYIETSVPRENGDHARLISPLLSEEGTFCLTFWHNMHGSDVKDLNVYLKGRKSKKLQTISHLSGPWSVGSNIRNLAGEDNDWWNQESVEFTIMEPVNIIFEGVRGKNYRGDIAIDDILLSPTRCGRKSINCDFEKNTCGWTQMSGDQFNWLPNRGKTQTRNTGPTHDHTLRNSSGRYLYIETSWPRVEGDKAQLLSPLISCDKGATPVFNFWYNMNGPHIGPLKIYVTRDKGRLGNPVWEKNSNQGNIWWHGQITIPPAFLSKGSFMIVIEAERKDYQGDTGIDDVSLTGCRAEEPTFGKLVALTTPTATTTTRTTKATTTKAWLRDAGNPNKLPGGIECNFEQESMCGWKQDFNDQFDWELNREKTHSERTGPAADHTNRMGWYLYVEASSPRKPGDKAVIRSVPIPPSVVSCISFYYHMQGKDMGKLELLSVARGGQRFTKHWSKQGQQSKNDTDWKFAQAEIRENTFYVLAFRATIGHGFYSDIAIDDVKIDATPCEKTTITTTVSSPPSTAKANKVISTAPSSNDIDCDFSGGKTCQWSQVLSPSDEFDWTVETKSSKLRSSQTGPFVDHTSGSRGDYAYIDASTPRDEGDGAMLESPEYLVESDMCFHFWYHMFGTDIGNLTLYRKVPKSGKLIPLWTNGGNKGSQWLEATVDMRKRGITKLVLEAKRGEFWKGDIAIDDFKMVKGKCPTFDCNFEENNCAWRHELEHVDFNWTRHQGKTTSKNTGPDYDHTLGNKNGTYLYVEASNPRQRYDKARLVSPVIDPGLSSTKCVTFWFHSFGDHVGAINIYKIEARQTNSSYLGSPIWINARNEGDQWVFAKINVHGELPYQIMIEGVRGLDYLGDIAIDDIKMIDGVCNPCCEKTHFKCGNHYCIPIGFRCNHRDDCGDGSDESFCDYGPPCGTPYSYAPIREPVDLPDNVMHDESSQSVIPYPVEEEEDGIVIMAPETKDGGAARISNTQMKLLSYPKNHNKHLINPRYYSEDMQFDLRGSENVETFVEREKRSLGSNMENAYNYSPEYIKQNKTVKIVQNPNSSQKIANDKGENYESIDLIKIQGHYKKISQGDSVINLTADEQKVAKKHFEYRVRIQKVMGKQHEIENEEWKLMTPWKRYQKKSEIRRAKRSVKKIIGGVQTSQYNYPWQVAYYVTESTTKSHYFCGATLIDRYWVITAAHCPHLGDVHNIVIGDFDLYTDEGTEQEIIVDAIFLHEKYKFSEDLVGDIALIKLRYPARSSKSVQPACLLKPEETPFKTGEVCVTTGWGRVEANKPGIERYLRQVEMPIISNKQCQATFWSIYTIHNSYVCAGGTGGNSCRGDSGGPLLCKRDDKFYLVGITSWGDTRCKTNIPGVYTRVQSYNKWMDKIMAKPECTTQ